MASTVVVETRVAVNSVVVSATSTVEVVNSLTVEKAVLVVTVMSMYGTVVVVVAKTTLTGRVLFYAKAMLILAIFTLSKG